MVRSLLDAVDVVLEGGVTPGVVLLLLERKQKNAPTRRAMGTDTTQNPSKTRYGGPEGKQGEAFGGGGGGGSERGGRTRFTIAVAE